MTDREALEKALQADMLQITSPDGIKWLADKIEKIFIASYSAGWSSACEAMQDMVNRIRAENGQ